MNESGDGVRSPSKAELSGAEQSRQNTVQKRANGQRRGEEHAARNQSRAVCKPERDIQTDTEITKNHATDERDAAYAES